MRALKAATIIMGVLIIVGTAVLIAVIIQRATAPAPEATAQAPLVPTEAAPYSASLRAPAGSRIIGIAAVGSLLAVSIGGSTDEVVVLDPRTGRPVGTIGLTSH